MQMQPILHLMSDFFVLWHKQTQNLPSCATKISKKTLTSLLDRTLDSHSSHHTPKDPKPERNYSIVEE